MIPSVALRYGGPSEAVVGLCSAQREMGMDARIATTDADGPERLGVRAGEWSEWRGVPAIFFRRYWGEALKFSPGLASWLSRGAGGFDLLHVHAVFSHSVLAAARAARRAGRPYVLRPLGTLGEFGLQKKEIRKRWFLRTLGCGVLENAAAIHCTSEAERRQIEELGFRKTFVVPLGVNVTSSTSSVPREKVVLFLGRVAEKKNVEVLIQSLHELVGRFPGWRLRIAGAGEASLERKLRDLAADGPARGRIEFLGWVEGEKKAELLSTASLFALPSRDENFGLAAGEAMAAGMPVVLTPGVDLAPAVLERSAGWVAPEEGFTKALAEAMTDDAERGRRGEAAQCLARERFGWDRVVRMLSERYEEILR